MALPLIIGGVTATLGVAANVLKAGENVAAEKKLKEPPNPNDPIFGSVAKQKLEQGWLPSK